MEYRMPTTECPRPESRYDRSVRRLTKALGCFTLGLATYAAVLPARDQFIAVATPDNDQEKFIESTLESVIDTDIRVDCVGKSRVVFAKLVNDPYDPYIYGWNVEHEAFGRFKTIHLRQDVCDDFVAFAETVPTGTPSFTENEALNIATHETIHAAGTSDEAEANCYAIQLSEQTALILGASGDQAAETRRVAAELTSPRLPDIYQSDECVDGGAYDMSIGTPLFPPTDTGTYAIGK